MHNAPGGSAANDRWIDFDGAYDAPRPRRRLAGGRAKLDEAHRIGMLHRWQPLVQAHGHVGNDCGNGLEEAFESFLALAKSGKEFAFVTEVLV